CDGNNQYDSDCTTSSGCSYCSSNNWAGALEACDLAGKRLPDRTELLELISYMYDIKDPAWNTAYTLAPNASSWSMFGLDSNYHYFSSDQYTYEQMYWIRLQDYDTCSGNSHKSVGAKARCVTE
ncbi:MAG: hypothetical protein R3Y28_07735, partial [Candidatus Gastranaerophilales bacterium]